MEYISVKRKLEKIMRFYGGFGAHPPYFELTELPTLELAFSIF